MIWIVATLILIVVAWYGFEWRWDRRLFAPMPNRICQNLRPRAAMELLRSRNDVQVLDVRSKSEFNGGALPGAISIALNASDFRERVAALDKTKPVLAYCAGGFRSRKAVEVLRELGFESIYNLHRGYHSWRIARLSTEQTSRCGRRVAKVLYSLLALLIGLVLLRLVVVHWRGVGDARPAQSSLTRAKIDQWVESTNTFEAKVLTYGTVHRFALKSASWIEIIISHPDTGSGGYSRVRLTLDSEGKVVDAERQPMP
jgi:rhodanese-related sulfurtransferase